MTKTAETIPFGAAHIYIAHKREYPPPPGSHITPTLEPFYEYTSISKGWF